MALSKRLSQTIKQAGTLALALSLIAGCSNSSSTDMTNSEPESTSESTESGQSSEEETESTTDSAEAKEEKEESEKDEAEALHILCPTGAPALATLGAYEDQAVFEYTQGQELLVSELAKSESDYDLIVAPLNLGVKAYQENPIWDLDAIITWGNLYIVGKKGADENWNEAGKELQAFGQGAIPQLVFSSLFPEPLCTINWLPSVAEAGNAFLTSDSAALLAEPQVTVISQKLQEQDQSEVILADLQELWQQTYQTKHDGYPQAAIFSKKEDAKDVSSTLEAISSFIEESDDAQKEEAIDQVGAETLGTGSTQIAIKSWASQHIDYQKAKEVKEDILTFLDKFSIPFDEAMLG